MEQAASMFVPTSYGFGLQVSRIDRPHNAVLRILDEVNDILNLGTHRDLLTDFDDSVLEAEIAGIYQAVGIGNVTEDAFGHIDMAQDDGVDAMVACGIAAEDDVRRNVFLHATAALDEREAAHTDVLLDNSAGTLNGVVLDLTIAGNADVDTKHALIAHLGVMANMNLVHDEIAVADQCSLSLMYASGNDHILADGIVVANDKLSLCARSVVEILRFRTQDSVLVHLVVRPHTCAAQHTDIRMNDTVVTDFHVAFDVSERHHLDIFAEFSVWTDAC